MTIMEGHAYGIAGSWVVRNVIRVQDGALSQARIMGVKSETQASGDLQLVRYQLPACRNQGRDSWKKTGRISSDVILQNLGIYQISRSLKWEIRVW